MNAQIQEWIPHNTEAEQQVLGALLLDPTRLDMVTDWADLFADPLHADIFRQIRTRHKDGLVVSPVALRLWAEGHEGFQHIGGAGYLVKLAGASLSSNQIRHYAGLLADLRDKRRIHEAIQSAQKALQSDEAASDIAARLEAAVAGAQSSAAARGPVSMMKATTKAMEAVIAAHNGEETPGVATGIAALDRFLGKFKPGQLILLGGRPSMGKSAVALQIALHVARGGGGVVLSTLEMAPEAMAMRALSEQTGRNGTAINYGDFEKPLADWQMQKLGDAAKQVAELPIQFLSTEYRDPAALYAGVKQAARWFENGPALVVIDYLQLLKADGRSRMEQITQISIALKELAMRLQVPVLALSQLSRALESREDKRPMLSDLRESGQLEQDADAVLFCYRDEYYIERDEPEPDDLEAYEAWQHAVERARNKLEIIVAKQRMGPVGTARVGFNPAINRVWDYG